MTRTARRWNGKTRAPLCPDKRKDAKFENGVTGAALGGLAGAVLGPVGALVGAITGACIGSSQNPDRC
jgi:outer membrane lipoprotein SlyB